MNRRSFLQSLGAVAAYSTLGSIALISAESKPQLSITMDDPQTTPAAGMTGAEINRRILDVFQQHKLHATLFVCGMRVNSAEGRELLQQWNDAGHTLGNHSYSHLYFNSKKVSLQQFCEDIAKGEDVVAGYRRFRKVFRYPFFKEGDTADKRDGARKFLLDRGYQFGRATIDASDWAIDDRLVKRLAADPKADTKPYREFYLEHLWDRANYYDGLAQKVLGRRPRHTLLIHHRALNALFLGDVLEMFQHRGWKLISSDKAYEDPVYRSQPNTLPAGEGLIWALAKQSGKFESELRYPAEDSTYENPRMDALGL